MLIYLIGFPGSGKTTTGKRLATALDIPFVDLDTQLEARAGKSIQQQFDEDGEVVFRKREAGVLKELSVLDRAVVSTGGGTPCFHDNMTLMNRTGITVFLEMSAGSLHRRLVHAKTGRPLFAGKTPEELRTLIDSMLPEREKFYRKAQYSIKATDLDVRSLASWIRERIKKIN